MQTYSNIDTVTTNAAGEPPVAILVADDDPQEHLLITMAAQSFESPISLGFVPDGADLLRYLAKVESVGSLPDVICLDLRMPGFDGFRTLDELQEHPVFAAIPVVVFTSSARPEDRAESLARGAAAFQTKPPTFSAMEQFLERLTRSVRNGFGFDREGELDSILPFANSDLDADIEDELLIDELGHRK